MGDQPAMPAVLRRVAAAAAGAVAGLMLTASPAAAQDDQEDRSGQAQTWSVQPAGEDGADGRASFDYQGPAGGSIDDYVQVNNFSEQPLTLRVYSQDAVNTGDGGYTLLPGDQPPADVGAWVGLQEQVTVPARDSVAVPFTLTIPANATPGDHPGGIVAALFTEATDEDGNPVLVDHRVGVRIYLRVTGELTPRLEITNLEASYAAPTVPFTAGEVTVTYTVTNTGNLRLQAGQQLTVRGPFGLAARTVTLERLPEILPGESVTTTATIDQVPPLLLTGELAVQPVPPLAGDPTGDPARAETTTWALPWRELLALVLVGLAVWWTWWRRRLRARRTKALIAEAAADARREALQEASQDAAEETAPDQATADPAASDQDDHKSGHRADR